MNGKRAPIFLGLSVAMTAILLYGSLAVQEATGGNEPLDEATGISAEAVLLTVLVADLFLVLHPRTRLFGLACALAAALVLLLFVLVASQVA